MTLTELQKFDLLTQVEIEEKNLSRSPEIQRLIASLVVKMEADEAWVLGYLANAFQLIKILADYEGIPPGEIWGQIFASGIMISDYDAVVTEIGRRIDEIQPHGVWDQWRFLLGALHT